MKFSKEVTLLEVETININEVMSWVMDKTNALACIKSDYLSAMQVINSITPNSLELLHIFICSASDIIFSPHQMLELLVYNGNFEKKVVV